MLPFFFLLEQNHPFNTPGTGEALGVMGTGAPWLDSSDVHKTKGLIHCGHKSRASRNVGNRIEICRFPTVN